MFKNQIELSRITTFHSLHFNELNLPGFKLFWVHNRAVALLPVAASSSPHTTF